MVWLGFGLDALCCHGEGIPDGGGSGVALGHAERNKGVNRVLGVEVAWGAGREAGRDAVVCGAFPQVVYQLSAVFVQEIPFFLPVFP